MLWLAIVAVRLVRVNGQQIAFVQSLLRNSCLPLNQYFSCAMLGRGMHFFVPRGQPSLVRPASKLLIITNATQSAAACVNLNAQAEQGSIAGGGRGEPPMSDNNISILDGCRSQFAAPKR